MDQLIATMHLHPIVDHFTIALLTTAVLMDLAAAVIKLLPLSEWSSEFAERLTRAAIIPMALGGVAAVCSYLTGGTDADRLWDAMPPAAQALLFTDQGAARLLAHATLGRYLMYAFLALAAWRTLLEWMPRARRSRPAYLFVALIAISALLYQGKTGGELVYDYGVGTPATAGASKMK
jgi:uncharacterized membrane protein